jgi:hypothetical protein
MNRLTLTLALMLSLAAPALSQERNVNLALDGDATASASSTINSGFPAMAAIDGDRKGYGWGSGGGWNDATREAFPDSLTVSLTRSFSVGRVTVVGLQDSFGSPVEPTPTQTCTLYGVKDFEVQTSQDGVNFTTQATVTGNNLCVREVVFTPVRARHVRVVVNASWDGLYSRVIEAEIYPL